MYGECLQEINGAVQKVESSVEENIDQLLVAIVLLVLFEVSGQPKCSALYGC
jgi:hypothetical protein